MIFFEGVYLDRFEVLSAKNELDKNLEREEKNRKVIKGPEIPSDHDGPSQIVGLTRDKDERTA